jgi:hypothetical protein
MMKRHWLAPRKDGSWDVIDSEAVADAYRNEGRVKVEGPFVPAEQLEGAVGAIAKISERAEHDRSKGRDVSCDWLKRVTADALAAAEGR